MPSTIGEALKVTVFGQSHSPAIGCVIEGLPSGVRIDEARMARFMARRAPGQGPWTTPRKEADSPRFVAGLNHDGTTCGAPLVAIIENANTRSSDYDNILSVPRPGHADLTAWEKWHGNQDVPGGGHFSGRLTAPLCVAGALALQLLEERGARIGAHLAEVAGIPDEPLHAIENSPEGGQRLLEQLDRLSESAAPGAFPVLDEEAGTRMRAAIEEARAAGDSVGGVVECVATGLPAGMGSPMFDGMENLIARAAFGIPAVKGIEFGAGFSASRMRGSEHNDPYEVRDGAAVPTTNHAGGILGGITTGAPLVFRLAIKPTSSIGREQDSVDLRTMAPARLEVKGRHDPCIAPRAVPVAEAVCALAVLDAWLAWPPERPHDKTERSA